MEPLPRHLRPLPSTTAGLRSTFDRLPFGCLLFMYRLDLTRRAVNCPEYTVVCIATVLPRVHCTGSLSEINFPNTPLRTVCDDLAVREKKTGSHESRQCTGTWMVVRFVRVIRLPARACARVSRVCPGSPRCLFTGTNMSATTVHTVCTR